ncbi:hypothetical protein [Micromonospora sp. URMC 103]|uniref:hypothetical protein n=1 Tax=Micromonospora sp. URMC 103 TaxID=3423406 RepID=UPI003F1C93F7
MTEPTATPPPPSCLESVLQAAWNAYHPDKPAPCGWLTHTTAQIHAYLRDRQPTPQPQTVAPTETVVELRRRMWNAIRDAVRQHGIDIDLANRILDTIDLPGLPRRWQVRLTLPVLIEVTATSPEDAFDTAEAAIEDAVTNADLEVRFEWDGSEHEDADPGELDPDATEPSDAALTPAPPPPHSETPAAGTHERTIP